MLSPKQDVHATDRLTYQRRRRKMLRELVRATKGNTCHDCGRKCEPTKLSFHHRDPATKRFMISRGAARGMSWGALLTEIAQCDPLCHRCHSRRTPN